jgi:hypothetical protein
MFSLQTSSTGLFQFFFLLRFIHSGLMDGRKFAVANANGQNQSANPNSEQSAQSQGPSPPFGPSPFSNSSPALQNVQQMANSANSASSSSQSNHQSPIANFSGNNQCNSFSTIYIPLIYRSIPSVQSIHSNGHGRSQFGHKFATTKAGGSIALLLQCFLFELLFFTIGPAAFQWAFSAASRPISPNRTIPFIHSGENGKCLKNDKHLAHFSNFNTIYSSSISNKCNNNKIIGKNNNHRQLVN